MNNIHPIIQTIEDASWETEIQHRLIGEIVTALGKMSFIHVAFINDIVKSLEDSETSLVHYNLSEMLDRIEKDDLSVKPNWNHSETQERGN